MTGPVSGGDGKYYILIEYEWNKELWWVPAEDVKEVVPAGGRKKPTPNQFRPGEKNESNDRSDQRKKLIHASKNHFIDNPLKIKQLNEAMETSRRALDHPGISGHLSLSTRVGLNQITESDSSNTDIEELVNLPLTYEVLRGLTIGKIPFTSSATK